VLACDPSFRPSSDFGGLRSICPGAAPTDLRVTPLLNRADKLSRRPLARMNINVYSRRVLERIRQLLGIDDLRRSITAYTEAMTLLTREREPQTVSVTLAPDPDAATRLTTARRNSLSRLHARPHLHSPARAAGSSFWKKARSGRVRWPLPLVVRTPPRSTFVPRVFVRSGGFTTRHRQGRKRPTTRGGTSQFLYGELSS
jgi:hypothetical protein